MHAEPWGSGPYGSRFAADGKVLTTYLSNERDCPLSRSHSYIMLCEKEKQCIHALESISTNQAGPSHSRI